MTSVPAASAATRHGCNSEVASPPPPALTHPWRPPSRPPPRWQVEAGDGEGGKLRCGAGGGRRIGDRGLEGAGSGLLDRWGRSPFVGPSATATRRATVSRDSTQAFRGLGTPTVAETAGGVVSAVATGGGPAVGRGCWGRRGRGSGVGGGGLCSAAVGFTALHPPRGRRRRRRSAQRRRHRRRSAKRRRHGDGRR